MVHYRYFTVAQQELVQKFCFTKYLLKVSGCCTYVYVRARLATSSISVVLCCSGGNGLCLPILFCHLVSDKSTNLKTALALQPPMTPFYLLLRLWCELLGTGQIVTASTCCAFQRDFPVIWSLTRSSHAHENIYLKYLGT